MSHEDAVAAIEAAVQVDPAFGGSPDQATPPAPQSGAPAGEPVQSQVQPEPAAPGEPSVPDAQAPAAPVEDTFDDGTFNPDQLPPELQPGWRQLQAAFTRKTQELAEQRKQFEALGDVDPNVLPTAVELYNRIQDPHSWVQLHQELGQLMEHYGLAPVSEHPEQPAAQPEAPALPEGLADDPELAPLLQHVQQLQARLDQFESSSQERAMQAEAERQQAEFMAEINRQESAIRQMNPEYADKDIDRIYELAVYHEGDLMQAAQSYEAMKQDAIAAYLASKSGAHAAHSAQPQTNVPSAPVERRPEEMTLQEHEAEAVERLRALQAAGELDF